MTVKGAAHDNARMDDCRRRPHARCHHLDLRGHLIRTPGLRSGQGLEHLAEAKSACLRPQQVLLDADTRSESSRLSLAP